MLIPKSRFIRITIVLAVLVGLFGLPAAATHAQRGVLDKVRQRVEEAGRVGVALEAGLSEAIVADVVD